MRLMLNLETPGAGILVSMQSWAPRGVSETEQFRKVSAGGIMAIAICRGIFCDLAVMNEWGKETRGMLEYSHRVHQKKCNTAIHRGPGHL
jgi:hypothetical protein